MTTDLSSSDAPEASTAKMRASFMRWYVLKFGITMGLFGGGIYYIKYNGFQAPKSLGVILAFVVSVVLGPLFGYLLGIWEWRVRQRSRAQPRH